MTPPSAPLLGVRFVAALLILGVGPTIVWDLLRSGGLDAAALGAGPRFEWAMLGFVLACAAVVGMAVLQPPAAWRPLRARWVLGRYAAFLLGWVPLLLVYLWAMRAFGRALAPQEGLAYFAHGEPLRAGFWLVAFGSVVAAPLAEEVAFRGYLQGGLRVVLPRPFAIAVASLVFGLCHTLPYALPTALLGALFGWMFDRCGSLWPAVLAHAVHNLLTVTVTFLWPGSLDLLFPR